MVPPLLAVIIHFYLEKGEGTYVLGLLATDLSLSLFFCYVLAVFVLHATTVGLGLLIPNQGKLLLCCWEKIHFLDCIIIESRVMPSSSNATS